MKILVLFCFCGMLLLTGCRRHDWRELAIHVPEMHNDASLRYVMEALGRGPGLKPGSVSVDPRQRVIQFKYDSLLAADLNFVFLITEAGFSANGIPGNEAVRAALPPEIKP